MNYASGRQEMALVTGSTAGIGFAIADRARRRGRPGRSSTAAPTTAWRRRSTENQEAPFPRRKLEAFAGDLSEPERSRTSSTPASSSFDVVVNNLGTYRAEALRPADRRRLAQDHRDQFLQRPAPQPRLPPRHAPAQLGPDHFHLQRIRHPDPGRDDPLRRDQDHADRPLPRPGRNHHRHRRDREHRPPRPDQVRGRGTLRQGHGPAAGQVARRRWRRISSRPRGPAPSSSASPPAEEVAHLVTYVASPLSAATNGAALRVDGGVVRSIF